VCVPVNTPKLSGPLSRPSSCKATWLKRADGSATVFALFVFLAMLLVAGVAVDMMRVEHERVRMQGASDRAVLAATMMRENLSGATPEQIVLAYMTSEGLGDFVRTPVTVVNADGGRSVTVDIAARIPATFMRLLGVNDVAMNTPARAIEALGRIDFELVLVLDVSGSMMDFGRMESLRSSVIAFAESLFENTEPGQLGLTIVPYSTEVILPPAILTALNPASPTNILLPGAPSYCIDFDDWPNVRNRVTGIVQNLANGLGLGLGNGLGLGLGTGQGNGIGLGLNFGAVPGLVGGQWRRRNCDLRSNTAYLQPTTQVYLTSLQQVRDYVETLGPVWGTSIDLGVVTGALFFDPMLRPAIETMVSNGQVHASFADRPFDWDRPGVMRAMVLMTDGENCCFHANHAATRQPDLETQNTYTLQTCAGLKEKGVTIYAVAYEAPVGGVDLMRACATSDNHFFSTSANALIDIFRGISTHIQLQALRLVE
jgi:hypothetical protein